MKNIDFHPNYDVSRQFPLSVDALNLPQGISDITAKIIHLIKEEIPKQERSRPWFKTEAISHGYSLEDEFGAEYTKEIIDFLEQNNDSKVLEVGSGNSHGLISLCQRFTSKINKACGLDLFPVNKSSCQLNLKQGDVLKMPYPDNEFDLVYSAEVFQYVADKLLGLQEIFRTLKPRCYAYVQITPWCVIPQTKFTDFLNKNEKHLRITGGVGSSILKISKHTENDKLIIPTFSHCNFTYLGKLKYALSHYQ